MTTNTKFQIGERVAHSINGCTTQGAVYEVVRVLPKRNGERRYEIQNTVELDDAWSTATAAQMAGILKTRIKVVRESNITNAVEAIVAGRLNTVFNPMYPTRQS